jgi:Rrf2 family protein
MLSKTCQYALRMVLHLATVSPDSKKTGLADLASILHVPERYLGKLGRKLVKKGVVRSSKGPGGGFYLDEADLSQSLMDIVKVVEGDDQFYACALGLEVCSADHPCPIHFEVQPLRDGFRDSLINTTVGELAQDVVQQRYFLTR